MTTMRDNRELVEVGQAWGDGDGGGQLFRVEDYRATKARWLCRWHSGGEMFLSADAMREGSTRLKGHPWEMDPDWREGDYYSMLELGTITKVRDNLFVAKCEAPTPTFKAPRWYRDTEWGPALTFPPKWQAVFRAAVATGDWSAVCATETMTYSDGSRVAGQPARVEEMVFTCPPNFGKAAHQRAVAQVDAMQREAIMPPQSTTPQPAPTTLTRAQLIAAVSDMCPPELVDAAWRYAVERYAVDCDRIAPELNGDWSTEDVATVVEDLADQVDVGGSYTGGRLYNDGLRAHALAQLIERRPDDLTPWGWERVCVFFVGEVNKWTETKVVTPGDYDHCARRIAFTVSTVGKWQRLYATAPQPDDAKWWDRYTKGPATRGHHCEDGEAV